MSRTPPLYPQKYYPNHLGTLAAQKRATATDRARLLHALALTEEAITSLAPLVQEHYPDSQLNHLYAWLTDASAALHTLLHERNNQ